MEPRTWTHTPPRQPHPGRPATPAGSRPAAPGDRHHPPGQRPAGGGRAHRPAWLQGRMLDWWFKFFETTQHIKWWHPHDHVEHRGWDSHWRRGESYVGASIHAVESLADIPPVAARLKFHDPAEAFGDARLRAATEAGDVSAAVYARIGFGDHAQLDAHGDPLDGDMVHLARDTPFGCVLRSRFYLGKSSAQPERDAADELGLALLRHCYTEFTYLSRFLPSIYYGEHGNGEKPRCPGRRQGVGPGGRSMLRGFIPAFVPSSHARQPRRPAGRHRPARVLLPVLRPAGRQHPFPALVVRRARPGQRLHRPDRRHRAAAQDPVHSCRRPRRRPDRPRPCADRGGADRLAAALRLLSAGRHAGLAVRRHAAAERRLPRCCRCWTAWRSPAGAARAIPTPSSAPAARWASP